MGFVHFNENGWLVDAKGEPMYVLGVNYVASYVCTNFFEDWRPEILEADLAHIAELGLNAVRIPIFWGYAEPEEGVFNPLQFERFETFLGWAEKYNLYVMPWFLVGVATVHKDIPYRQGRPFFEGHMLFAAERHLREFARRYKNEERILFWDICDEPEFYARNYGAEQWPYDKPRFRHWLGHMYQAFRQEDPHHLVTLGFGEIATENYGYNLKDSAEILDFLSVTCYPYDSAVEGLDTARNNYYVGFYVKMNTLGGKPVFTCEAPGFSTVSYSEAMLGRYFKVSIYSNLINGSTGVMPWCYNDFAEGIWRGRELDHQPLEPTFGIVDNTGRLKATGQALVEFGDFVRRAGITDYTLEKPRVGILLPCGYYDDVYHNKRKVRAAMQFAKGCGADIAFVWDDADLAPYDMLIVSAITGMHTSAWERIARYVENGGTLLHSYDTVRGLSVYHNAMLSVEIQTRQKDFGLDSIRMEQNLGSFHVGEVLTLPITGRDEMLVVEPKSAAVYASFADGHPAILKNQYGKGTAWLMTGQFHTGLFEMSYSQYRQHPLFDIYHSILSDAGIYRPVIYRNPELEAGLLHKNEQEKMLVLINHSPDANAVSLSLGSSLAGSRITDWRDTAELPVQGGTLSLAMEAAEVRILNIDKGGE